MALKRFLLVLMMCGLVGGCDRNGDARSLQGWVEADLLFVSADEQGRIERLNVREGDHVTQDEVLFTLDDDLQKSDLQVRRTATENAEQTFQRAKQLLRSSAGTQKTYDDAEAALQQAVANQDWSKTRLMRRSGLSPAAGVVQQLYFRRGETVQPGKAILSLLPPGNLKIRFFAPEKLLPRFRYGQTIQLTCDGCVGGLEARVSFIASSAEYTPPVIYTREERAKLVYLIEARPSQPDRFRVGQPVTVMLPDAVT